MNIAIIGPEKFAFQDMACIDLALSFRRFGRFELVPEPEGGEDASLTWEGAPPRTLEIQVKGAKGTAGITQLAQYLAHYPARTAGGSLLERLLVDDTHQVLFVLTARCDDDLTPLLLARPFVARPGVRPVPRDLVDLLRNEITKLTAAKPPKGASRLDLARLTDLRSLATRPIEAFEKVLERTMMLDQETAESIEVRLHAALRAERFDTLSIRGTLARLSDVLSESKRQGTDAFAKMLAVLDNSAPSAVRPTGYLDRGIESDLEAHLRDERVLLLAGPPRAGKTWTARAVAGRLQVSGFEVRQGIHIDDAERFLTDAVGAERAYVLDDPIGAREPMPDANARLASLRALIERVPANRRLIVAQSEPVLLQTRAAADLAVCALGGKRWRRIEPPAVEVAQEIWRSAATAQGIPASGLTRIKQLIVREPALRDPGALAYLAQTWADLPDRPLDEEIVFQARRDAVDFARALAMQAPAMGDLLTASALATSASEGATGTELAFIVNGGDDRPALEPSHAVITFGGDSHAPPAYAAEPLFGEHQNHALATLQRRRVLVESDRRFNFIHPYLRAGAQSLISPDIPQDRERIVAQVERALSCPSPVTSLAAARNLRWLRAALPADNARAVFVAAQLGIRSLFPATRDCSYQFLIEFADQLPDDLREEIPQWSQRMLIQLEDLDVEHGIGFISNGHASFSAPTPLAEVQPFLGAMESGAPLGLDLSLAHRLLKTLEKNPGAMTNAAIRRFLRSDEAVVRATAARIWCKLNREDDADILSRLETDAFPVVSVALLHELAWSWNVLGDERRERILAALVTHAHSPGCASVLLNRLVLFNRIEHFGQRPPWRVFVMLMPIVIANLPLSVSFANGRFDAVVRTALGACRDTLSLDRVTPKKRFHRSTTRSRGNSVLRHLDIIYHNIHYAKFRGMRPTVLPSARIFRIAVACAQAARSRAPGGGGPSTRCWPSWDLSHARLSRCN